MFGIRNQHQIGRHLPRAQRLIHPHRLLVRHTRITNTVHEHQGSGTAARTLCRGTFDLIHSFLGAYRINRMRTLPVLLGALDADTRNRPLTLGSVDSRHVCGDRVGASQQPPFGAVILGVVESVASQGTVGEDGPQIADPVKRSRRRHLRTMGRVGARRPALIVFVVLGCARMIFDGGILSGGISRMRNQHAQVPARASTRYRNALRVNAELVRVGAEETHRLLHIVQGTWEERLMRIPVVDGRNRPACLLKSGAHESLGIGLLPARGAQDDVA